MRGLDPLGPAKEAQRLGTSGPFRRRPPAALLVGLFGLFGLLAACGGGQEGAPGEVRVAVAASFLEAQDALAARFQEETGVRVRASAGSTGQLYAQIVSGAPFDVLLAADSERPRLLEEGGQALPGSRFTYATGRLALYGAGRGRVRPRGEDLMDPGVTYVAIANPRTAPYGAAAMETLRHLDLEEALGPRLVRGESALQAFQYVRTGAAELGFVPYALVVREPEPTYWLVPESHHAPIRQDAVQLRAAENPEAAAAYLRFLRSTEAARLMASFGYEAAVEVEG